MSTGPTPASSSSESAQIPTHQQLDSRGRRTRSSTRRKDQVQSDDKENANRFESESKSSPVRRTRVAPTANDDLAKRSRRQQASESASRNVVAAASVAEQAGFVAGAAAAGAGAAGLRVDEKNDGAGGSSGGGANSPSSGFVEFSSNRLWVDARDNSSNWWPAELVDGPRDDEVQVRFARYGGSGENSECEWVDLATCVATAGTFAFYGTQETTLKQNQVVLVNCAKRDSPADNWLVAVVAAVSNAGVVSLRVLDQQQETGDGVVQAHGMSGRIRPLGPSRLSRFNKVPVPVTIARLSATSKPAPAPEHPAPHRVQHPQRAPLSALNVLTSCMNESKQGQVRGAGDFYRARVARRIVSAASAQHGHFQQSLRDSGMELYQCAGDGNCLYRAVAHQIYGNQELHGLVRNIAFEHMRAHEEEFSPFCSALMEEHVAEDMRRAGDMRNPSDVFSDAELFRMYINMYSRNGVWGGDPEISAMCRVYTRTAHIFVYDRVQGHRVDIRDVVPGAPPMLLSYYGGGHYDSITDRCSQDRLLQMEPGLLEQESIRQYGARLHRFYHPQAHGPVAAVGVVDGGGGGGGGAARENYVASDDQNKSRRNATLGKKGRPHLKQAIAKLFGTNDLAVVDDEQLLKEMEDHNVQAVLNVTGNNDPDDLDKPGGVDAHVVSKDFVEMQQAIMRQVADDNARNPVGGGDQARDAAEAADAIAAVAAIEAAEAAQAEEKVGAANVHGDVGNGGPAPEMTEEEQIAYALALSASENPVLAAVDLAADAAADAAGSRRVEADAEPPRSDGNVSAADADAQAQWAIMQSTQGNRRVTRSQTRHGNSGLLQQADGLSEEELMSIALALSEQDGSAASHSAEEEADSNLQASQHHESPPRPPPGLSLAQGPESSSSQQE